VSIVIVLLDRIDVLRRSLAELGDEHQVLVVDNGSVDGSHALDEEFPNVRFIRLPKNFGLTKALNIGIRAADGTYVLILHDDAVITGEAVSKLADYLEQRTEAGAVAPLLLTPEGELAPQVRELPSPSNSNPAFYPAAGGNEIGAACVSGAAIMFRTFFLRALRQIDERYGTYGGIIELCMQVRRANRKIVVLREVTAVHEQLVSPVNRGTLEGDRTSGTAVFLGRHYGFVTGILYRLKSGLAGLFTFRFKVVAGALAGAKIDGAS
jgi:GT2 family glycosyltransferase